MQMPFTLRARQQEAVDKIGSNPTTQLQLATILNTTQGNASALIFQLRKLGVLRIAAWVRGDASTKRRLSAAFVVGCEPDAERPAPLYAITLAKRRANEAQRVEREAQRAANQRAEEARARSIERMKRRGLTGQAAAIVEALRECGDMTAVELADTLSLAPNVVRAVVSVLRYWRLVHVGSWTRECPLSGRRRQPLPVFALGNKRDAAPPPKLTKAERNRLHRGGAMRRDIVTSAPASVFHLGAMLAQRHGSEVHA